MCLFMPGLNTFRLSNLRCLRYNTTTSAQTYWINLEGQTSPFFSVWEVYIIESKHNRDKTRFHKFHVDVSDKLLAALGAEIFRFLITQLTWKTLYRVSLLYVEGLTVGQKWHESQYHFFPTVISDWKTFNDEIIRQVENDQAVIFWCLF